MQKLTYINSQNQSIEMYKGGAYILEHVEGTGSTNRKISSIKSIASQGEHITSARREPREVVAKISVDGKTRADMYEKREKLCNILSLDKAFDEEQRLVSRLVYENSSGRWWTPAILEDGIDFNKRLMNFDTNIKLSFRCPSSYWYGITEDKAVIKFAGGGFKLPFKFPINFGLRKFEVEAYNQGNIDTPLEIEIEGKGEKTCLYNERTGIRLKLKEPIPQGYRLKINTDRSKLSVRLYDTEGNDTNAFGMLDPEYAVSDFILKVGNNRIIYETNGEAGLSVIRLKWYTSYEGV